MIKDKNILIELHCLPSIEYYQLIANNTVHFEAHENYNKRSYRNKFSILTANGIQIISIPLQKGKNNRLNVQKVKIAYDDNWIVELKRTFVTNYKNAPYFDHYIEGLMPIFEAKHEYLFELNLALIKFINIQIGLRDELMLSVEFEKLPLQLDDFRNTVTPKHHKATPKLNTAYDQVFEYKFGFTPHLSIIDLLFNTGPETLYYLR